MGSVQCLMMYGECSVFDDVWGVFSITVVYTAVTSIDDLSMCVDVWTCSYMVQTSLTPTPLLPAPVTAVRLPGIVNVRDEPSLSPPDMTCFLRSPPGD